MNMHFTSFINVENLLIKVKFLSVIPIVPFLTLVWVKYFMKCKNMKLLQELSSRQGKYENPFWVCNMFRQQQFLTTWRVAII